MAKSLNEIVAQIPPNGISDWDLAANNDWPVLKLRHYLSRFPHLESFQTCRIKPHPVIKGKIITIYETIWRITDEQI